MPLRPAIPPDPQDTDFKLNQAVRAVTEAAGALRGELQKAEVPPPQDLGFGGRLANAVAGGFDPRFAQTFVEPLIRERQSFPARQQEFNLARAESGLQIAQGNLQAQMGVQDFQLRQRIMTEQLEQAQQAVESRRVTWQGSGEQPAGPTVGGPTAGGGSLRQQLLAGTQMAHTLLASMPDNAPGRHMMDAALASTLGLIQGMDEQMEKTGMPPSENDLENARRQQQWLQEVFMQHAMGQQAAAGAGQGLDPLSDTFVKDMGQRLDSIAQAERVLEFFETKADDGKALTGFWKGIFMNMLPGGKRYQDDPDVLQAQEMLALFSSEEKRRLFGAAQSAGELKDVDKFLASISTRPDRVVPMMRQILQQRASGLFWQLETAFQGGSFSGLPRQNQQFFWDMKERARALAGTDPNRPLRIRGGNLNAATIDSSVLGHTSPTRAALGVRPPRPREDPVTPLPLGAGPPGLDALVPIMPNTAKLLGATARR